MNKLNKPKAFEASESITTQSGIEIANLLRSGIKNQTVILVGHNQKWHEIEIESLRIDEENFLENSHLESAAHYIDVNKISLSDMGIIEEEVRTDYDLKHDDFMELQSPKHDYIQISKLYEYMKKYGIPHSKKDLEKTLQMISEHHADIDSYILSLEKLKDSIVSRPDAVTYEDVVNTEQPQQAIIVDTVPVPVPVQVPSDSVSLQIFEKLTPEKITELQGLRITQEEIVKNNPVVIIKDKKTYAEAKKVAAILLSASTAIDGSKGIETTATKYLNTFKTMLKTALVPIAKLTREPYDKQKKLIEDWDNRLLIQAQNRVKELFAVPFTYNSESDSYSVGSLVVTQKDIEEKNDADFAALVAQGKAIIIALESVKSEQDSRIKALEDQNALLQDQIKAFMALQNPITTVTEVMDPVINMLSKEEALEGNPFTPSHSQNEIYSDEAGSTFPEEAYDLSATIGTQEWQEAQKKEKQYSLPHPDNKLLNELDLAHISVLEEKQYIECREYYKQGLSDAAEAINDILVNPDKNVQKSVAITELIKTWTL